MPRAQHALWAAALAALLATSVACKSDPAPATPEAPATPKAPDAPAAMKLTPEGQKFDPPVRPDALPHGAWYCDMGTVHYARSEKGDATCPICKMTLTEKAAAK